nr:glycosyltransferase [Pelagibacteraceae bacterium]
MNNYDVDLDMNGRNSSSLIIRRIAKNSTVLEFGPANGRMTKYLKETLGCTIYAVELNEESAKDAAEFCQDILVGDIEKFKWLTKYQEIEFDYIIFADVLEHLYNPETVLTKAKTLLKNEGSILISLPNIAHNAIIMDLLNDKFTYKKMGLLDSTHIRFFTKNTLEELITNSGLEIAFETASYAEPSNTEFKNSYTDLGSSVALLLSEREFGEAYQFIFEAKHSASDLETDFLQEDTASLYIDTGKGFNELEKVTTIFNSHKDKVINFTVDSKIFNVKAIRIDPLEIALSLKIENMIVNDIDETNKVKHGAIIIGNNELKFLDSDPQLVIEFDESITLENVALEYKYLTKNYTAKNEKIELQTQQIQDKDTLIENQAQQIQDKDTLIENQAQQIQSLGLKNRVKRLLGMYQSTSFFRKEFKYIKNNPSSIKLGLKVLKSQGIKALIQKIKQVHTLPSTLIDNVYKYIEPELTDEIKSEIEGFTKKPLISIIMPVYNVDPKWLDLAIKSIKKQWYENWELCIVDDKSTNKDTVKYLKVLENEKIKIKFLTKNLNISNASNEAVMLATGEYIALLDNDDELTCDALYEVIKVINKQEVDFIYSDEDKLELDGSHV